MSVTFIATLTEELAVTRAADPHHLQCNCGAKQREYASYAAAAEAWTAGRTPRCGDELCARDGGTILPVEIDEEDAFDVNLCNGNARHLLELLGLTPEVEQATEKLLGLDLDLGKGLAGELGAEDFLGRVLMARAFTGDGDATSGGWLDTNGNGRTFTQVRDGQDDARVLAELETLARWCAEHGRAVSWA